MRKNLFLTVLVFAFFSFVGVVFAQTQNLVYPIAQLGYCRDAKECYLYCEIPRNKASCWSYGKYKLSFSSSSERVLGQDTSSDEEEARRLGITFPIAELGNCSNVSECKAYCDNPSNQNVCIDFARKKGIGGQQKYQAMMNELGCRSQEECRSLCENPGNQERCMAVAEKHIPGEFQARKVEMLKEAREILGCDSMSSCQAVCQDPANREKCMRFAEKHMPEEARARMEEMQQSMGGREEGLGCSTEEECRSLCEQNPERCPGFSQSRESQQGSGGVYDSGNVIRFDQGQQYQNYSSEGQNRNYDQFSTPQPTPLTTPEETSRF